MLVGRQWQAACIEQCQAEAASIHVEHRAFKACVCCAMLHWSENLYSEYLAGPLCTIQDRAKFAKTLRQIGTAGAGLLYPRMSS